MTRPAAFILRSSQVYQGAKREKETDLDVIGGVKVQKAAQGLVVRIH